MADRQQLSAILGNCLPLGEPLHPNLSPQRHLISDDDEGVPCEALTEETGNNHDSRMVWLSMWVQVGNGWRLHLKEGNLERM